MTVRLAQSQPRGGDRVAQPEDWHRMADDLAADWERLPEAMSFVDGVNNRRLKPEACASSFRPGFVSQITPLWERSTIGRLTSARTKHGEVGNNDFVNQRLRSLAVSGGARLA